MLEGFADRHNLRLERYYHQNPTWDFLFRHPAGGVGKIEVWKQGGVLEVRWYWWIDTYDELKRQSKKAGPVVIDADEERLGEVLAGTLHEVLSWRPGALDEVSHQPWWASTPRDVVELAPCRYPLPRL